MKRAALFHLDLHLRALESGFTLTDASAYNVQFVGTKPIFIDPLSLVPYSDGQLWFGQRQFHEQFLNPLLLTALLKIPFNPWYRGAIEGVSSADLANVLRVRHKLSWRVWSEVLAPVWLQKSARKDASKVTAATQRKLPLSGFRFMLRNLRTWIAGMCDPFATATTTWRDYAAVNSYLPEEEKRKQAFVSDFVRRLRPRMIWDLGCNTGLYSETALRAGAQYVVGFDSDHGALSLAVQRSLGADLNFLPLQMDACNPSPSQGWHQQERAGLSSRSRPDAILALALEHHIAIGRNVPLPMLLDWMIDLADSGVVEFVPKTDPVIQRMLGGRQDIFDRYSQAEFESELAKRAAVEKKEVVSASGRTLYAYTKKSCMRRTWKPLLSLVVLAIFSGVGFLNFYRINFESLTGPSRLVRDYLIVLAVAIAGSLIAKCVFRAVPIFRIFLVAAITAFMAFNYDAIKLKVGSEPADLPILLWVGATLFAGFVVGKFSGRAAFLPTMAIVGLAYIVPAVISLIHAQSRYFRAANNAALSLTARNPRNVYWIVLDGYPRADVLRQFFDFDNEAFLKGLRDLDFVVYDRALASFPETIFSISSTLSLGFLQDGSPSTILPTADLYPMVRGQNVVVNTLRSMGYRYVHFQNGYDNLTDCPLQGAVCISGNVDGDAQFDEFNLALFSKTPLMDVIALGGEG